MLWLALHFPQLGLEVWTESPGLSRPTVLVEDNRVVLCNPGASAAGIVAGSTLATAHSISSTVAHFQRDSAREQARLRFLAEILYRFSNRVSLEQTDGLVLEIGASLGLFGDATNLAREAERLCDELGHEVRWQLADTPEAALVMARANARQLADVPLGCTAIPNASQNVERFANMGMFTLAPLLQLPETELGQRFGQEVVDYLARLTGRAPDLRRCIEPAQAFAQSLHLLEPVRDKAALLFPMQRLLNELSHWLRTRQLGAEQLLWSFSTHTEAERVALPLKFASPMQSKRAMIELVRLKLEQVTLPSDVLNVRLTATRLAPWQGSSQRLFRQLPDQSPGSDEDLNASGACELLDQLRARLGEHSCSGISVHDQHAPEMAWAAIEPIPRRNRQAAGTPDLSRPLWLFDPPHPTSRERLTLLRGPERIQTGWWQQVVWRDYYVASLEGGATCWAFVDGQNQWYLHGYFG